MAHHPAGLPGEGVLAMAWGALHYQSEVHLREERVNCRGAGAWLAQMRTMADVLDYLQGAVGNDSVHVLTDCDWGNEILVALENERGRC